jgi:hypothetical protein
MTIDNFKNYKEKETFEKELVEFWKDEIRIRGGKIEDEEEENKENDNLNAHNTNRFTNYKC